MFLHLPDYDGQVHIRWFTCIHCFQIVCGPSLFRSSLYQFSILRMKKQYLVSPDSFFLKIDSALFKCEKKNM